MGCSCRSKVGGCPPDKLQQFLAFRGLRFGDVIEIYKSGLVLPVRRRGREYAHPECEC